MTMRQKKGAISSLNAPDSIQDAIKMTYETSSHGQCSFIRLYRTCLYVIFFHVVEPVEALHILQSVSAIIRYSRASSRDPVDYSAGSLLVLHLRIAYDALFKGRIWLASLRMQNNKPHTISSEIEMTLTERAMDEMS